MPFIVVICVLWLKTAMTHLRLNGLMHLDDEFNRPTSLNSESASLNFVINQQSLLCVCIYLSALFKLLDYKV